VWGVLLATPPIGPDLRARLDELDELRSRLGLQSHAPSRWMGSLRRLLQAEVVEGSTSIEGFRVSTDDALALLGGETQALPGEEDRLAVACYGRAMDHVVVMARDPAFRWLDRAILDLHFDACWFQPQAGPGLWRTGPVGITGGDGRLVYEGPDAERVPALMAETVRWLHKGDLDAHVVVRAAMAHLHLISIHPFRDGNGRVSRIAQSLVLARDGLLSPEFGSIEEYLGENTPAYYAALQQAHGECYEPDRDASGWVAFCIDAHLAQARRRLAQIEAAGVRWAFLEELATSRGWPERIVIALEQSLIGGATRTLYAREAEVSAATASADLRRLLDAGLVVQRGQGRTTRYHASADLRGAVEGHLGAEGG
jgi:Fic family protein